MLEGGKKESFGLYKIFLNFSSEKISKLIWVLAIILFCGCLTLIKLKLFSIFIWQLFSLSSRKKKTKFVRNCIISIFTFQIVIFLFSFSHMSKKLALIFTHMYSTSPRKYSKNAVRETAIFRLLVFLSKVITVLRLVIYKKEKFPLFRVITQAQNVQFIVFLSNINAPRC